MPAADRGQAPTYVTSSWLACCNQYQSGVQLAYEQPLQSDSAADPHTHA